LLQEGLVQAAHIDGQADDVVQVSYHVGDALVDQVLHLQKVAGNQDRDNILEVEHRLVSGLNLLLLARTLLLVADVLSEEAVLLCELGLTAIAQVLDEPVEDFNVAVHRYVDVVGLSGLVHVAIEVAHVPHKKVTLTFEILTRLPVLIVYMDSNLLRLLERESLHGLVRLAVRRHLVYQGVARVARYCLALFNRRDSSFCWFQI